MADSRRTSSTAPRHFAVLFLLLLFALLAPGAALSQEARPEVDAEDEARVAAEIRGSGVGRLRARGADWPLPYTITVQGPVVSLREVASALGGELASDPLGQSVKLTVLDREYVLGAGSAAMTEDERILPLSRQPLAGPGGLEVPLDVLAQSFGEGLGYRFEWIPGEARLEVTGGTQGELAIELSSVHVGGTTSLVLTLSEEAPLRLERSDREVYLVFPARHLGLVGSLPAPSSLVAGVALESNKVRVLLRANAAAADPYRVARGGRTQWVLDVSESDRRGAAPAPIVPSGREGFKIVIDPGHGGTESGAVGPSGTLEKDLTLAIARLLRSRLESRLPVRIVLTRDDDSNLDLVSRTSIANQNQADLFLSIHLNSAAAGQARGAETYILDAAASDARAEAAARFENSGAGSASETATAEADAGGSQLDLQLILWDLAQTRHLSESLRVATLIQQELNEALELRDRGVKQAPFKVLTGAHMPAALVELGFLSHPDEEARLRDPAYRGRLVDALVDAIVRYWASRRGGSEARAGSSGLAEPVGAQP
ncbi:MAG TPA: N-acetylmuramoyl-L-alanine amidase [Thermoanaerobaculia bacterium]|nr:N-acetylmuramoyl-L-alanine amidase [Thermoanaerobaculia bacterium]